MQQASFRFYAELNDLLPLSKRELCFSHAFEASASVKDTVEAFGIPHTEVDLILVNGETVTFSYLLRDGDRISVYPVFRSLDLGPLTPLQPRSGGEMSFVLDTHLGKLAAYLRMLGFDSVYRNNYRDEDLVHISLDQQRTLLSRDRGLLKRSLVTRGYLVREPQPREQLLEVLRRFNLSGSVAPFRRLSRLQHPAASRPQGPDRPSPPSGDEKTLRRVPRLPRMQPPLLEGIALPTHGSSYRAYD